MANGHGGARIGAGKKKKPLANKILDDNPASGSSPSSNSPNPPT